MKRISVILPVLAPTPFLRAMTEFAIATLRLHADNPFELIVVEACHDHFDPHRKNLHGYTDSKTLPDFLGSNVLRVDRYLNFNPKIGGVREINAGIRAASGDFIVTTGNDVIAPPHWDTELLRCFEERKDCGVASLSAFEPGTIIGPPHAMNLIVEGMYSPFNMFRRGWEYDEDFARVYQDSDLIMRLYEAGLRAYRSCRAHVHHLLRMTNDRVDTDAHNQQLRVDEELFYKRWGDSPLAIFGLIRSTTYQYAREHESFVRPVGYDGHPANRRPV